MIKNFNKKYTLELLKKLLKIPSPTGMTQKAVLFLKAEFEKLDLVTEITPKGALIAAFNNESLKNPETVFTAHTDTLGLMVRKITGPNTLMATKIGSFEYRHVEGEYVNIHGDKKTYTGTVVPVFSSVHAFTAAQRSAADTDESYEIRLDTDFKDLKAFSKSGITVGDFISLDERCRTSSTGFICSRHLDDKAGAAALLSAAEHISKNKEIKKNILNDNNKFAFFISTYEETGHGGSPVISPSVTRLIAVDMAVTAPGQTSLEKNVTICAKDSSGPYDLNLKKDLIKCAKKNNLAFCVDIYPYYGSDASAALRAGHNIQAGLIGPGVASSHSYERTHIEGILNTAALITSFLNSKNTRDQ